MSEERRWTDSQLRAINCAERDLLLSAGAGAGKTATLTERVCRLVCDRESPADVSRMLIVTFTKAAAEELRGRVRARIAEALEKDPDSRHLARQIVAIGSADISTISSFFLKVIKPYFAQLGLPPSFTVADEAEIGVMKEKLIADVVDDFFDDGDDGVTALADAVSSAKDENSLGSVILTVANGLAAKGFSAERLDEWAAEAERASDGELFDTGFGKVIRDCLLSFAEHYLAVFSDVSEKLSSDPFLKEKYLPSALEITDFLRRFSSDTKLGYKSAKRAADAFSLS
ncbi:MAG: UvrD-helicase domain-containing protein, partial [Clostridia bacterium]|nr:UvrD-helicase domain-containing protein [Clostridia bacterium]